MTERVACHTLGKPDVAHAVRHSALDGGLVEVMSPPGSGRVHRRPRRGKHVPPRPALLGGGILPQKCARYAGAPNVRAAVSFEASLALPQVSAHGTDCDRRERGPAILVSLSAADDDFAAIDVHILDAETHALEQAQSTSIHQRRAESVRIVELLQNESDFTRRQDDRYAARTSRRVDSVDGSERREQHMVVQKHERAEGLVLGRGRDVMLHRQRGQKGADVLHAEIPRMPPVVE